MRRTSNTSWNGSRELLRGQLRDVVQHNFVRHGSRRLDLTLSLALRLAQLLLEPVEDFFPGPRLFRRGPVRRQPFVEDLALPILQGDLVGVGGDPLILDG
jgi:hypothetical protein